MALGVKTFPLVALCLGATGLALFGCGTLRSGSLAVLNGAELMPETQKHAKPLDPVFPRFAKRISFLS